MINPKKVIFIIIICVVASSICFAQKTPIKEGTLGAKQWGNVIRVSWISESEDGVSNFEVYRSTSKESSIGVCIKNKITPRGSGSMYTIEDNCDLLKTEASIYYYKIKTIYADGSAIFSDAISTVYYGASSTPKRTWGSIKAMFR